MNILFIIIILATGFFIWVAWGFIKYKSKERMDKNEIYSYLRDGLSLEYALRKTFSNLNKFQNLGLQELTLNRVSEKIAGLINKTDMDNVIEIYSDFIHRYIFRGGQLKNPQSLSDQKILYALESMEFNERNGYFVIKPDKNDDFDNKYPNL
ncbi:MAG: hypothetical protein M0R20_04485 [Candidatus Omnitrophica bacterium]|jgi:hypothetical protein|nr:hypothetical protein [Candidatus Omnitrophota bacterium]